MYKANEPHHSESGSHPHGVSTGSLLSKPQGESIWQIWLKLFLFLTPCFLIIVPSVYLIDAYKIMGRSSIIAEPIRVYYGERLNPVLWKLPAFTRDPKPNIVLGDSQMARLSAIDIEAVSRDPYVNLAYPGGTLRESIATFWYVARTENLKKVYFGVSFIGYNAFPRNRVDEADEIIQHPLTYFVNFDVLETSLYDVMEQFFHRKTKFGPNVSRDAFWRNQLADLAARYRSNTYPAQLEEELKRIAGYCKAHQISLVFVIPPQHTDAQKRIHDLGVEDQYSRFKRDLASIAPTYDYVIDSDITRERDNYADPFHLAEPVASRVTRDLWSGELHWARKLQSF